MEDRSSKFKFWISALILVFGFWFLVLSPMVAHAASFDIGLPFAPGGGHYNNFNDYFVALMDIAIMAAIGISIIILIYAGFLYARSEGQAAQINQAKELVAGVITGLAVIFLIRLIEPTLGIKTSLMGRAWAQDSVKLPAIIPPWTADVLEDTIWRYLTIVLGVLAFVGVIYSAWQMAAAQGDPAKFAAARKNLIWLVIGIIVITMAGFLVRLVTNCLGGGAFPGTGCTLWQ